MKKRIRFKLINMNLLNIMSLDINRLKESINYLNQDSVIYVDLQISGTEDFIRCGIIRISQPRIGLELLIERDRPSQISISEFQNYLEGLNKDDNIGYMLIEPEFSIQRGSNISSFFVENNNLILISLLFPRPV